MAYLYGELEGYEKEAMDKYLFEHPEARVELERLQQMREHAGACKRQRSDCSSHFCWGKQATIYLECSLSQNDCQHCGITACLSYWSGKFSGMKIQYQESELRISFGGDQVVKVMPTQTAQPAISSVTPEEVQAMINASLDKNNLAMQSSWKETQQQLDASITKNLAQNSNKIDKLVKDASAASQDQIRQFVSGMQTENLQLVKNYFKFSSDEQKQYIESLLVDFSKYLQQQRNDDLRLFKPS